MVLSAQNIGLFFSCFQSLAICVFSVNCGWIDGEDLSKPDRSKKEGKDTSKKKKGDVDGKGGDDGKEKTLKEKLDALVMEYMEEYVPLSYKENKEYGGVLYEKYGEIFSTIKVGVVV